MTREEEIEMINIKSALKITNAWLSEVQYEAPYFGCGDMEAIKKALEKQIPKKPTNKELKIYSGGTQVLYAYCPICEQPVSIYNGHQNNKEFRRDEDVFCKHCGQALDWSEPYKEE